MSTFYPTATCFCPVGVSHLTEAKCVLGWGRVWLQRKRQQIGVNKFSSHLIVCTQSNSSPKVTRICDHAKLLWSILVYFSFGIFLKVYKSGDASWWRVCYQWGLPHLVLLHIFVGTFSQVLAFFAIFCLQTKRHSIVMIFIYY